MTRERPSRPAGPAGSLASPKPVEVVLTIPRDAPAVDDLVEVDGTGQRGVVQCRYVDRRSGLATCEAAMADGSRWVGDESAVRLIESGPDEVPVSKSGTFPLVERCDFLVVEGAYNAHGRRSGHDGTVLICDR